LVKPTLHYMLAFAPSAVGAGGPLHQRLSLCVLPATGTPLIIQSQMLPARRTKGTPTQRQIPAKAAVGPPAGERRKLVVTGHPRHYWLRQPIVDRSLSAGGCQRRMSQFEVVEVGRVANLLQEAEHVIGPILQHAPAG